MARLADGPEVADMIAEGLAVCMRKIKRYPPNDRAYGSVELFTRAYTQPLLSTDQASSEVRKQAVGFAWSRRAFTAAELSDPFWVRGLQVRTARADA